MSGNLPTATDRKRIWRAVSPAAEPTSLAPSGDATSPVEGSNTEDGGGGVGGDASDFCGEGADGISGIRGRMEQQTKSLEKKTEIAKAAF